MTQISSVIIIAFILLFNLVESAYVKHRVHTKSPISGRATWFIPSVHGGPKGACGDFNNDDDFIVAMNAEQYGNMFGVSNVCGKTVTIRSNGKTVKARVTDACPECRWGDLDLTRPVFKKLANLNIGNIGITWSFD